MSKFAANDDYSSVADRLALAREMYSRIMAVGQSYQVALPGGGTQMKTLPPLADVAKEIERLQQELDLENAAGSGDRPVNYARMTRRI